MERLIRLFESQEARETRKVGEIADTVQNILMTRYGLDKRQFEPPSMYIYGKKSVEIPRLQELLTPETTDFFYHRYPQYYSPEGTPLYPQWEDTKPALYFGRAHRIILADHNPKNIARLLSTPHGIDALLALTEEVGHFLDFQKDLLLQRPHLPEEVEVPIVEGLALLHKRVILDSLGAQNVSQDALRNAERMYSEIVETRRNRRSVEYRAGTKWIEGFLQHDSPLPKNVARFYQMEPREQLVFMKDLYEVYRTRNNSHPDSETYIQYTQDLAVVNRLIEILDSYPANQ